MPQTYYSYGWSAFEAVMGKVVHKRVIFAVSLVQKPGWLSWYVFVEAVKLPFENDQKDLKHVPDSQGWDNINVFGASRPGGGRVPFTLSEAINVNQFSGQRGKINSMRHGSLIVWGKGEFFAANIRISLASGVADLAIPFVEDQPILAPNKQRQPGLVWLLGSTPFTPSAFDKGPISTPEAGNFSAYDRHMSP